MPGDVSIPDPEVLDPKIDIVFRALFGQERNLDLLQSLVNGLLELLGKPLVTELKLLPGIPPIDWVDQKLTMVDLAVRDATGTRYVIEMQCQNHRAFRERMLYYATQRYGGHVRRSSSPLWKFPHHEAARYAAGGGWSK